MNGDTGLSVSSSSRNFSLSPASSPPPLPPLPGAPWKWKAKGQAASRGRTLAGTAALDGTPPEPETLMTERKWLEPQEAEEGMAWRPPRRPLARAALAGLVALVLLLLPLVVVLGVRVGRGCSGPLDLCGNRTWLVETQLRGLKDTLWKTERLLAACNGTAETLRGRLQETEAHLREKEGEMENLEQKLADLKLELEQLRAEEAASAADRASACTWLLLLTGILMVLRAA